MRCRMLSARGVDREGQAGVLRLALVALALGLTTASWAQGVTAKIIGGEDVAIAQNPWQVSLALSNADTHRCGGSLIDAQWVITAAHCVRHGSASRMVVRAGSDRLNGPMHSTRVRTAHVHPGYDGERFHHDIALLNIEPFDQGVPVQPIALASPSSLLSKMLMFMPVRVTGWGMSKEGHRQASDQLQGVELPVVRNERCAQEPAFRGLIRDEMLCLGTDTGDSVTCDGDSGGPASVRFGDDWVLVGLTSFGLKRCVRSFGVFTRVAAYADWIREHVGERGRWR